MIKKCTYTPETFKLEVSLLTLSIFNNDSLSDIETRNELFKTFASISEQMGLSGPSKVEEALNIIKDTAMFFFDEELWLDDNDIIAALTSWKHNQNLEPEDTTADHLVKDNEKLERINEDPFETYYLFAMNAKIRAKLLANKVGVRSILYNENGIINSITELNESIRNRQEELLKTIIDYLRTRVSQENQIKHPEIFSNGRMYDGENYTGIVEQILELYGSILNKENFDPRILNKYYNDGNYDILDAYSSWIILNNFDNIILSIFGKAISINPDMAKYTGKNKYRVAGGSNVYNTWRVSEDIDMSKEINNITQAIVTSLPFIPKGSTTPSLSNIKFNEFLYIISKIKGLTQTADKDWTIKINGFDEAFRDKYNGKSFLSLINSIRLNPQEVLPDIFRLLNNDNVINSLIGAGVIESNTFLNVDLDLINSLYEGLFNEQNPNSLFSIQNKTGFNKTNYFAFISLTIDSAFKSTYLQYFRNPLGEIFIRNMYDLSISNIEYTIRDTINSINSKMMQLSDDLSKYDIKSENREFVEGLSYNVYFNGNNYTLTLNNGQILGFDEKNNSVSFQLLEKLINTFKETPNNVIFTIKDFHKGPLKVIVSLNKNSITYEVNGKQFDSFNSDKDYDSLSDFIQETLRLNLNIDNAYFDAYKNKFKYFAKAGIATNLMSIASRIIANKYLSNTTLNNLTPFQVNQKLNQIFGKGKSDIKPTFNKQLGEINVITDSNTRVLLDLAEAKAQATGRLTSSQVIDSNGNAVASSSLSRLLSAYAYQITDLVLKEGSAAKDFSLWNTGVFKGISQMKEIQDNTEDSSKPSTEFSNAEMEYATVFVDFILSLLTDPINGKSTLQKGLAAFIPSENSDKTYIGRMLIDLAKLKIGEESIYDILRKDPRRIKEIIPVFAKELGDFYDKALANINSTWSRVGLILGINVSYGNWGAVALQALKEGKSTLQYINDKVTEYNNLNPTNPIVLIDLVHYVANKNGELTVNESFLENTKRFKDPVNLENFLVDQNIEVVEQLLKDRLRVPITPEIQSKIAEWRITDWKEASKWIDERTGEMIFAKVWDYDLASGEEELIGNIRRHNDISLLESINPSVTRVEINPIIESYNILNYFLTQEFMGSTVGMFYAHPNKGALNIQQLLKEGKINAEQARLMILDDEKARKLAQDKRNVSFTASMHSFLKNLILGIPDEINIAIMDDPHDALSTVSGETFDIKPFDGCTFENPWFGEMENASLGGAKVGVNKKTFTHYYDARTGTGGIIKTANFPLTNDRIRGSKFYLRMIRNMTDRTWKNLNGTDFVIPKSNNYPNVLIDYNENPIEFTNPNDINGLLYFKQNGKYYQIASIEYLGNNQFRRYILQVDIYGRAINEIIPEKVQLVNSNYKLWNLFGGAYSMEIAEGNDKLQYTENSIKIVANIINSIGTNPNDKTGLTLPSGIVRTQADVYQPLKHSDIHLMPTVGAVKQGAGNINGKDKYNISDPNQINFMRIKMNLAGIQLDKEHHADDEDLSIMTLVISACAARGYTLELQLQMLNALASLARAGINEYIEAFNEFFENPNGTSQNGNSTSDNYQLVILNTLVDALIHSTNSAATLLTVTQELINKAKEGKEIAFKDTNIPYSDPAVFRKLHSTIAVALTRGAIKIKVQGVLSVLCPSFGIVKLYNGRTLNSFDSNEQIQAEQEAFDAFPESELVNDIGRLKLGRTYKLVKGDGSLELRNVVTQGDYYTLKQQIANGEYYSVKELFAPVKDILDNLNPTNVSEEKRIERYNEVILKFGKPIKYEKVVSDISDSNTYLITFENGTIQVTPKAGAIIVNNGEFVGNKDINYFIGACKVLEDLNKTIFEGGRELGSYNATFQALAGTAKPMISTSDLRQQIYSVRSWQGRIEKAEELGLNIDKDTEPRNVYEYVCLNFPTLSRASVMLETGMKPADLTKFSTILRTNGISITQASEQLFGNLPEFLQNQTDNEKIREIIIDLLLNSEGPTDITRAIYKGRIEEALQLYDDEYQQYLDGLNEKPLTHNINDLASVHKLWQLKEAKASNEEINLALQDVQWDLNILSGLKNPSLKLKKLDINQGLTALYGVLIDSKLLFNYRNWLQQNPNGIVAYRVNKLTFNTPEAVALGIIGNPFDWLKYGTGESLRMFLDWIITGNNFGEELANEPFRQAIINKIKNSNPGSPILYYKELGRPSHATVIGYLINNKDVLDQTLKNPNDRTIKLMDGTQIQINPSSINIEPYEIVMPKIFASVFGLEIGDDLNVIKLDRDFFVKRLIQSIKPKVSNLFYSIGLMNIGSRSSMYILDRNQRIPNDIDNFIQKDISQISEKGKLWRVNKRGEKMYQMLKGDTVYEYRHPDGTSYEVIVSDKPEFYVKNASYTTLNCSTKYNYDTFYNILKKNMKNRAVRDFKNAVDDSMITYGDSLDNAIYNILNVEISDIKDSPIGNYFLRLGHEIHTSFLQSLKVVAARVPAQSMLSFMPMKVVAFEAPDINTAYVSTAQFLFQGSDLDIDAVSLASFTFDKSGRYIAHSPFADISTIENLEASIEIPFPTGLKISGINTTEGTQYSLYIGSPGNLETPFIKSPNKEGIDEIYVDLSNPVKIERFSNFIKMCNRLGGLPAPIIIGSNNQTINDSSVREDLPRLLKIVNEHNDYINSDKAEDFSKNYVVASMYKIGLSPANLIESQQALDSITKPLKNVANNTIKAKEESLENPAGFTTNIHGIAQNMAGKKGVGICAVGLKSFFALTARYNEVLRTGTPEELERLKSEVIIAGKKYLMLANAYGTNISNQAIALVVSELSNQDLALVLSALLSLATDNAKELALDKLNAANMLGMYIYGITIGVDFKTLADIICSETGLIINEMMQSNSFLKLKGMNIQNIFDYLETAPRLNPSFNLSKSSNEILSKLSLQELFNLTHSGLTIEQQLAELDKIKKEIDKNILHSTESEIKEYNELHRLVEQAEDYVERFNSIDWNIYEDFKKLNEGAEELRRLGQLLHINQGLENSYSKSINYLETVTSVIADRQYSIERENRRKKYAKDLAEGDKLKYDMSDTTKWKFDFHLFVSDEDYREAWIDIYEGKCNQLRFIDSLTYRNQFAQIFPQIRNASTISSAYDVIQRSLKPSKVFFNILDVLQVPHFAAYLQSADMLHQAMMKTSVKYRSVYSLGKKAINLLGAYSTDDKESIYRRTELMVDKIIRDRYYLSKGLSFKLPSRTGYFIKENGKLVRKTTSSSTTPIELGTDEGNASFKLFMESVVIPNLIKGKYGDGNNTDLALTRNEFIKSLTPTLYKHNAQYNVTINYAPGINMSPRTDAEKALFEKIKYDFNAFRYGSLSKVKYKIGDKYYDIPELFYYYNQIAFGGRPGENTLTSIFLDMLDYRPIKEYRDYESELDMEGVIEVDDDLLIRETALRRNPWLSNMKHIYYEDSDTGLLSFWTKIGNVKGNDEVPIKTVNGYNPSSIGLLEESKNYVNPSVDKTIKPIILSNKEKVNIEITKGKITKVIRGDKSELLIPKEAKPYFDNPPVSVLIQPDGSKQLVYDTNRIRLYVERLINKCS